MYGNSMHPDIYVMKRTMQFALLRNFGHLIARLYMEFEIYRNRVLFNHITGYLIKYTFEALIHLSLIRMPWTFEDFDKQFVNVKCLEIGGYNILNNSVNTEILEKFPNLQTLKIKDNLAGIPFDVKIHFPHLRHLRFDECSYKYSRYTSSFVNYREILEKNFKEFLKMNTQIENLEIYCTSRNEHWPPQIFQWFEENLPFLQNLSICQQHYYDYIPVSFPNVMKFTHLTSLQKIIPFSFNRLT